TPAKTLSFSSYILSFLRVWHYRNYPENLAFMRVAAILQGRLNKVATCVPSPGFGNICLPDRSSLPLLLAGGTVAAKS
ncbi:MAG: hypothetical protein JWR60_1504, partial [Polaromonas sp.]|nr:hypothetical protein [Polaromonas sp.]